ncbi:peptidoglycan DD-metalloendopeptidase family protein [Lebetimonas sp. JS032]|uniref:peptidoglycan DD-metalloendopeptidase family protein n=1 Tax=Lebetimonas sp. JS032 TaxID=990070 RepID=UPI00046510A8|nr:peptidoglycan DD-metalloendopeptidase family protein [Lebetimonas sp. JS032]
MKKLLLFLLIPVFILAYRIDIQKWNKFSTFYGFLKQNSLPYSIYYNLPAKLKRYVRNIAKNETIFILRENNNFKEALIPINSQKQLQIIKNNNKYFTKIIPIIYNTEEKEVQVTINSYLSYDLYKATHLSILTNKIINIFNDRINFRTLPKGTTISIIYDEKKRFSEIRDVKIIFAQIKNRFYSVNAFLNPIDNRYYDEKGRSLRGMFLKAPLRYTRISSPFGMRFHPILHKWRMHDGVDFVNKIGTPIHSVADGKIIYKGWIRGYGRSVEIRHKNGYMTLYAHLHGWPKGIYVGKWVKQGTVIGYLGNSGLSTGPHLHFGVMHNGKWINPLKLKNNVKITLYGKKRRRFFAYIKQFTKENNINIALK